MAKKSDFGSVKRHLAKLKQKSHLERIFLEVTNSRKRTLFVKMHNKITITPKVIALEALLASLIQARNRYSDIFLSLLRSAYFSCNKFLS